MEHENNIFPISAIEPLFKNGVKCQSFFKDLVINSEQDLQDHHVIFKRIVLKGMKNMLSFNDILLIRDMIRDQEPKIYGNFDEEAKYVSKKLNILCTSSQFKKVHLSKHFKLKVKNADKR
jgi:hypothetical protein